MSAPRSPQPTAGVPDAVALIGAFLLACALSTALIASEQAEPQRPVNWTLFGVIVVLSVVCERSPRTWITLGVGNTVTLLPAFAYVLVLLGSPVSALAAAMIGSLTHSAACDQPWWTRLFNLTRTMLSVATAGLVLFSLQVRGSVTQFDRIPWRWSLAIVLTGVAILLLEAVVTEIALSMRRRVSFIPPLRRGLALRLTAVGSLMSLAPIWVIGLGSGVVLAPLLGITTILVFASTRRSLERAHEAHHDPLTGLGNRRSFSEHLADACGGVGAPAAGVLLLMDLDGFKEVNDRLGHDVGDAVLVAFADRLESCIPPNAVAARLGGDEFAALLTWSKRRGDVDRIVHDLHAQLCEPLVVGGFTVSVGVSIGVARLPDDGRSADVLLRAADIAMYRSKRLGTSVERYHADSGAMQTGRLGMLTDLAGAVRNNELRVDYQPQLSMADGRIVAVEALVRWQHPEHGTIAPDDFIGLAEQTDLIGPITDMVLRMATGGLLLAGEDGVRLAVNVSVRNLQDPSFAQNTLAVLADIGFPARQLELEVTERALVTNPERSRATISELRDAGVRITVDGFGTGYASYQTLRTLCVDRVKIDRDFVLQVLHDSHDRAIVQSVVSLAHALGLEVIAEGVEAKETWDLLADMGCDAAQGFGIAMPMPLASLRSWMTQWDPAAAQLV